MHNDTSVLILEITTFWCHDSKGMIMHLYSGDRKAAKILYIYSFEAYHYAAPYLSKQLLRHFWRQLILSADLCSDNMYILSFCIYKRQGCILCLHVLNCFVIELFQGGISNLIFAGRCSSMCKNNYLSFFQQAKNHLMKKAAATFGSNI